METQEQSQHNGYRARGSNPATHKFNSRALLSDLNGSLASGQVRSGHVRSVLYMKQALLQRRSPSTVQFSVPVLTKSPAGIPLFIFRTLNHFKRNLVYKSFQFVQPRSSAFCLMQRETRGTRGTRGTREVHFNISSFHGICKERDRLESLLRALAEGGGGQWGGCKTKRRS
jgi:hypothetical protein